jgi:hypothetical protein
LQAPVSPRRWRGAVVAVLETIVPRCAGVWRQGRVMPAVYHRPDIATGPGMTGGTGGGFGGAPAIPETFKAPGTDMGKALGNLGPEVNDRFRDATGSRGIGANAGHAAARRFREAQQRAVREGGMSNPAIARQFKPPAFGIDEVRAALSGLALDEALRELPRSSIPAADLTFGLTAMFRD